MVDHCRLYLRDFIACYLCSTAMVFGLRVHPIKATFKSARRKAFDVVGRRTQLSLRNGEQRAVVKAIASAHDDGRAVDLREQRGQKTDLPNEHWGRKGGHSDG